MTTVMLEQCLRTGLAKLVGEECWSVIGGGLDTRRLSLHFGTPVLRPKPIANPFLSEQEQCFEGRLWLFTMCAWRLEHDGLVRLTSESQAACENRSCPAPFDYILRQRVAAAEVSDAPGHDLTLRFDNGASLRVFCDELDGDNWALGCVDEIFSIRRGGVLERSNHTT